MKTKDKTQLVNDKLVFDELNIIYFCYVYVLCVGHIKTHSRVSVAKKDAQAHQCVIYATSQVDDFSLS